MSAGLTALAGGRGDQVVEALAEDAVEGALAGEVALLEDGDQGVDRLHPPADPSRCWE